MVSGNLQNADHTSASTIKWHAGVINEESGGALGVGHFAASEKLG
jgi:hypothetical protein